jgi:hypothetical protein
MSITPASNRMLRRFMISPAVASSSMRTGVFESVYQRAERTPIQIKN